jgi:hypothetical protein
MRLVMRNFTNPGGISKAARYVSRRVGSGTWMSDPEFSKHINIGKSGSKYARYMDGVVAASKKLSSLINNNSNNCRDREEHGLQ